MTVQNETGGMTTDFGNGHKVLDGSGSISKNLGFDLNSREGVSQSYRNSARESYSQAETHRTAYNESTDKTFDQVAQFGQNTNKTLSYSDITSNKEGASTARAVSTMNSTVEEYAKLHNISRDEAESHLTSKWAGVSGTVGGNIPLPFGAKVGVQGDMGYKSTKDTRESTTTSDSESDRQSRALQEQFNASANVVKNYDLTDSSSETRTKADTALATIGDSLRDTESLAITASTEFNHARGLERTADKVQDISNSVSFNLNPDFQAYMKEQNPEHFEGIMYGSTEDLREQRAGYIQQFLNEPETLAKLERYTDDTLPQNPDGLRQSYEQQTGKLELTPAQRAAQQEKHSELQTRHDEGVELIIEGKGVRDYFDENRFNTITRETNENIIDVQDEVADKVEQHQTPLPEAKPQKVIESKVDAETKPDPITHPAMGRGSR
ncbi:hypothetical protein C9J12_25535 [Photobacterium frigidiphilum]|uniref:Conjugal transfer protein TraG n=1 Tax=Photobacterium frigidiphilum TaxID=264736 RepID=A0A2T3J808_9GAMM|nr:hypothetical protein C9J12_25535 [Photobacterium frigidiphilum]